MDERSIQHGFDCINKSNPNQIYRIISETCKTNLEFGEYNNEKKYFTSTTLLNQDKIFDGMTNIELIMDLSEINRNIKNDVNLQINVEKIQIRTRVKNKNIPNSYRNIEWDLEFDLIPGGYKILGLDNFIHMSLVGLEEIFLDIKYKIEPELNNNNINNNINNNVDEDINLINTLNKMIQLELKYSRCIYNQIIRKNLEKCLYENEENYFVDIIDYLTKIEINLHQEEKMFGNMFATNYNILRMMSGMGGFGFTN